MKLQNWSVSTVNNPYLAPEMRTPCLQGFIYGDVRGRWQDGDPITTSTPVKYKNGKIYTKSGSEYELGDVAPEYERLYPGARQRFLDSFDQEGNLKTK